MAEIQTYQLALAQIEAGAIEDALRSLDQVLENDPMHIEAYYQRAKLHEQQHNFQAAYEDYSRILARDPSAKAFLLRALAQLQQPNQSDWQGVIQDASHALKLEASSALAYRLLGEGQLRQGHPTEAIAAWKQGTQLYLNQGEKKQAKALLEKIEQVIQPKTAPQAVPPSAAVPAPPPMLKETDYLKAAINHINQGRYHKALEDLNWILQIDPNHALALAQRAIVYAYMDKAQNSTQDFMLAKQLAPQDTNVQFMRGIARLALGDQAGAIQDFSDCLTQSPDKAKLLAQRARAYAKSGDYDTAFKDYANAIGMEPNNPHLLAGRAWIQERAGDEVSALEDYQRAATLFMNEGHWKQHQDMTSKVNRLKAVVKRETDTRKHLIRVPLLMSYQKYQKLVVAATLNRQYGFEMIVDTGISKSLITRNMCHQMKLPITGTDSGMTSDGRYYQYDVCLVSIALQTAEIHNINARVVNDDVAPSIGQDFLQQFDLRILANEIELCPRP